MGVGYIPFLLQLAASALLEFIPSNIPVIGTTGDGGYRGGRQPLSWWGTFWAVFLAIIAALVVFSFTGFVLMMIIAAAILGEVLN